MNYKKKLLVISQGYWPEHFPINDLVESIHRDKEFEISVLTGYPNYPEGRIYKGYEKNFFSKRYDNHSTGYKIFRVPIIRRIKNSKISIIFNYLSFIIMGIVMSPFLLRKEKFDYILVFANSPLPQAFVGIFLKFVKSSKLILWVQDLWPEILRETGYVRNNLLLKIINYIVKLIYYFSDIILAQSQSFKREIQKKIKKKIIYFPNPSTDMSKKIKKKLKNKNKFKILYAGNLGKAQNFEKIIEISKKLRKEKKIIIQIIGGGNRYSWVKKKIKDENITNISLSNNVPFNKIPEYYADADCLLISLKKDKFLNMTIPSKLQNYLSAKKPILSFCGGETKKIIEENKCGLNLYNLSDKEISERIIYFSKSKKETLNNMSNRGYKFFKENFEINKIKEKFYQIFINEKI